MRALHVAGLASVLFMLLGCSGNQAEVSGEVRLDGQLVEEGAINFIPVEGTTGPAAGAIIKNGKYHISRARGATVGKNRVELRAFKTTGRKVKDVVGRPGTVIEERVPAFPPEYNDNSTLVKDIHTGVNTIDFDIRPRPAEK